MDFVPSVNGMVGILAISVAWYIWYVLKEDAK